MAAENCRDFWKCPKRKRDKCLIYRHDYGRRCWFLAGGSPQVKRKFHGCWTCPWYVEVSRRCFLRESGGRKKGT